MIRAMNEEEIKVFCSLLAYHRTNRFRGIVRINDHRPCALVGFDDFTPNSCQMHVWLRDEHSVSKRLIIECFRYAFDVCKLGIVIGVTPCNNAPALELNRRLGFELDFVLKDGYAIGVDLALQSIRKQDCRWWPPRGRQSTNSRSSSVHGPGQPAKPGPICAARAADYRQSSEHYNPVWHD